MRMRKPLDTNGYLPVMRVGTGLRKGRSVYEGYQRGWGIEFGDLRNQVRNDPLYKRALECCQNRSILMEDHRINMFLLMRFFLPRIGPGAIVEFGAYRGGNAIFMAHLVKELGLGVNVYALDTFAGMPKTDKDVDAHNEGDFRDVNFDELVAYARSRGLDNLKFCRGLFHETIDAVRSEAGRFSLAHIDCDTYPSVKFSYEAVRDHMVDGGYVVFDDATVSSCIGATEAVEEEVIRRDGLCSEQIFPHFVFRIFNAGQGAGPEVQGTGGAP
jgi:predicted O-methyltransferase YrrM